MWEGMSCKFQMPIRSGSGNALQAARKLHLKLMWKLSTALQGVSGVRPLYAPPTSCSQKKLTANLIREVRVYRNK